MAKGVKTGGRQKGTLNKRTYNVAKKLEELNCDPIEGMVIVATRAMQDGEFNLAGTMYKELAGYIAPKKKAVEVTGESGGPIQIRWADE